MRSTYPGSSMRLLAAAVLAVFCSTLLASGPAAAGTPAPPAALDFGGGAAKPAEGQTGQEPATPQSEDDRIADVVGKTVTRWNLVSGTPIVLVLLGAKMWEWGSTHSFRYGTDGWFEIDNSSGGTDKTAHIYACYASTRLFTSVFDWTEDNRDMAIAYGALMGLFIGAGIEIGDGFSQAYGFSVTDLIADFAGIGIGALLDKFPALDRAVSFTVWWFPSKGFLRDLPGSYSDTFTDYSGQHYFLSLKLDGIPWVQDTPLRFFQIDLAYRTNGYKQYDRVDKRQTIYMGFSVDLGTLLSSMLSNDPWSARLTQDIFKYVHPPLGMYPRGLSWTRWGEPYQPGTQQ